MDYTSFFSPFESPRFITPREANALGGGCLPCMLKVTGATAALVSVAADLPFYFQNLLSIHHLAREVGLWNATSVLGHQNVQQQASQPTT